MTDLSTSESAIYDRQIRLWGSSAQMRIKKGKILVFGISGTCAEICKNTVLAGANLVVADDRRVSDETSNFLISLEIDETERSSLNVAEATAKAVMQLNEHPSVSSIPESDVFSTIPSVDTVVISVPLLNLPQAVQISAACREHGKAFFCVIDSDSANWCFSDMGSSHVVESHTAPLRRDERTGDRSADQRIIEYEFSSFQQFIDAEWKPNSLKSYFPLPEALFAKLYCEYMQKRSEEGAPSPKRTRRAQSPVRRESWSDFVRSKLGSMGGKIVGSLKDDLLADLEKKFENISDQSLPHMAAIHGALVSQEIVKYITKRDIPLVNQIVLNPRDCGALVIKVPSSLGSKLIDSGQPDEEKEVEIVAAVEGLD
jgi:hypothetical protein